MKSLTDKRPESEAEFMIDQLGEEERILEDGIATTLFSMVDHERQRIILVMYNKGATKDTADIVNLDSKDFNTDNIVITNYHATYHSLRQLITIFLLDSSQNKLFVTHMIYPEMQKYTFLSREIHLSQYGQDFLDIKCIDIDQNQFEWECTLSSVMKIITINIYKKQTFDSVSEFIFKHELKKVYINTLQDHYLIEGTKYIWAQNNDYFFLTNSSKFIKKNHIVMFKRSSLTNYSYYFLAI